MEFHTTTNKRAMKEELKEAIAEIRQKINEEFPEDVPHYIMVRKDVAELLLSAIPGPETVAVFPPPIPLSALIPLNKALKQAYGHGLLVKPYAVGGFQVVKPEPTP